MERTIQSADAIPVHFVNRVNERQQRQEEQLARKNGGSLRIRRMPDLSMGLSGESDKFLDHLQERYEKEKQEQQPDTSITHDHDRAMQTAQQYALHRSASNMSPPSQPASQFSDNDNSDDEKENIDVSGRQLFGFVNSAKRRAKEPASDSSMALASKKAKTKETAGSRTKSKNLSSASASSSTAPNPAKGKRTKTRKQEQAPEPEPESDHEDADDDNEDDEDDEPAAASTSLEADSYERYFEALHGPSVTSNHTLSNLPALEPEEFESLLKATTVKHKREIATLVAQHERCFPQWFFELTNGFNLMFYGYGSKRQLLNKFAMDTLRDGPLVVINGYFPSVSVKDVLQKILVGALDVDHVPGSVQDQVNMVRSYFCRPRRLYNKLYLVIHNLDGPNLRNDAAQGALAALAEMPHVHLVASMDHVNAGLLWDNVKTAKFGWIYHDATTFDSYLVETSFENTLMMSSQQHVGARGIQYVLASLTSNARGIFRILAEHQLMEMEMNNIDRASENVALAFHQYYDKCRDSFYVSSEVAMRSQLTEFKDHKVITAKRLPDGTEVFYISLDKNTLIDIVSNTTD